MNFQQYVSRKSISSALLQQQQSNGNGSDHATNGAGVGGGISSSLGQQQQYVRIEKFLKKVFVRATLGTVFVYLSCMISIYGFELLLHHDHGHLAAVQTLTLPANNNVAQESEGYNHHQDYYLGRNDDNNNNKTEPHNVVEVFDYWIHQPQQRHQRQQDDQEEEQSQVFRNIVVFLGIAFTVFFISWYMLRNSEPRYFSDSRTGERTSKNPWARHFWLCIYYLSIGMISAPLSLCVYHLYPHISVSLQISNLLPICSMITFVVRRNYRPKLSTSATATATATTEGTSASVVFSDQELEAYLDAVLAGSEINSNNISSSSSSSNANGLTRSRMLYWGPSVYCALWAWTLLVGTLLFYGAGVIRRIGPEAYATFVGTTLLNCVVLYFFSHLCIRYYKSHQPDHLWLSTVYWLSPFYVIYHTLDQILYFLLMFWNYSMERYRQRKALLRKQQRQQTQQTQQKQRKQDCHASLEIGETLDL